MARKQAFVVSHKEPQLLVPAKPTPHEIKELSDIDDQKGLRLHISMIMFYRANPLMKARDPVEAIRDALAEALVWYYPLAGRIIHGINEDKFMVDCNGEGILFVEADSNFSLEDLGDAIKPPCLYSKELLYQVSGSDGILGCPLMLVQVTRLICGGSVVAIRVNHVLTDGLGLAQFVKAVGELAQDASSPSTKPVWRRELLTAKHLPPPLQTTYDYPEYGIVSHKSIIDQDKLVSRSFFFGPKEMKAIRRKLPPQTKPRSKFDLITASIWICRTRALEFDADETVAVICAINVRDKGPPELRDGYYGNAVVTSGAVAKARRLLGLLGSPLEYAVELIEKAKSRVTEDYVRSVVNFLVSNGRPPLLRSRSSIAVTDLSRLGFDEMDFGWGKPVYGGTMDGGASATAITHARYRNSDGEDGVLVPVFLPPAAMKKFEEEMKKFTALDPREVIEIPSKSLLKSTL
ncbi:methanol O-anthraniloyltransferase-like [Ipomoea triloba]|uniref:methanol O-anthraniloyltransferase-like n=1 Tax=Ipomoea triloba TaxID=35885 RepID=UPI00125E2FE4|nr:methanol O-anthraniloyltransferase-like [Ipomoea triloba]